MEQASERIGKRCEPDVAHHGESPLSSGKKHRFSGIRWTRTRRFAHVRADEAVDRVVGKPGGTAVPAVPAPRGDETRYDGDNGQDLPEHQTRCQLP